MIMAILRMSGKGLCRIANLAGAKYLLPLGLSLGFLISCAHHATPQTQAGLIKQLQNHGVAVTTVGQTVSILLPSDAFFYTNSANLTDSATVTMQQVAALMRTYSLVSVQVAAYSDSPVKYLQALTTNQAQTVASSLWDNGIDARLVYAVGYADLYPVLHKKTGSANRRVVITFRFYPAVSYYD